MTVSRQELLTHDALRPSTWRPERVSGMSETVTPSAWPSFGPDRREITLKVSRRLFERPWFHDVFSRLCRLLALGDNWNGYGERAVHEGAVKRAMEVLDVVGVNGPCPDVVPTSEGGVQLEWASLGSEVEVEIPPVGPASVYVMDASGEESEVSAGARNPVWRKIRTQVSEMGAATA